MGQPRGRRNLPTNLPTTLLGATEFTADPVMGNADWVVQTYNQLVVAGQIRDVAGEAKQMLTHSEDASASLATR